MRSVFRANRPAAPLVVARNQAPFKLLSGVFVSRAVLSRVVVGAIRHLAARVIRGDLDSCKARSSHRCDLSRMPAGKSPALSDGLTSEESGQTTPWRSARS